MVPREGVKSTHKVPLGAEVLISVSKETTNIGTDKRDSEHVHEHYTGDGKLHELNFGEVVAEPARGPLAHASEGASLNDEGALVLLLEPLISDLNLLNAE